MRYLFLLSVIFLFFGCAAPVGKEDLTKLNGYWEIEKVIFSNGNIKDFKINPTVDYIELEGLKGFRKKMHPKFDGSYTTSNATEFFSIESKVDVFEFHYKNDMSEWKEKIIAIEPNSFSVINEDTVTYTYKRFQPINVTK